MNTDTLRTVDLTMRVDSTGDMAFGTGPEYVTNIAKMIFNMVPGTDATNPGMGLNVATKQFKTYSEGYEDTAFENDIMEQFTHFTNLIPIKVLVKYTNGKYLISMIVKFNAEMYKMELDSAIDSLDSMLINV